MIFSCYGPMVWMLFKIFFYFLMFPILLSNSKWTILLNLSIFLTRKSFSETVTFLPLFTVNLLIHFLFFIILVSILTTQSISFRTVKPSVVIATVQTLVMIVIAICPIFVIDSNPWDLTVIMWTHSSEKPLRGTGTRWYIMTVLPRNKNVFRYFLPINLIFSTSIVFSASYFNEGRRPRAPTRLGPEFQLVSDAIHSDHWSGIQNCIALI